MSKKTFFTSDQHFGDKKLLTYENCPVKTMDKMTELMIKNWNKVVKKSDTCIVVGDVSLYDKKKTRKIIKRLNGRKILILGNHDLERSRSYWKSVGFNEVYEYPILFEDKFLISHIPRPELIDSGTYYNIHGHYHTHGSIYPNDKWYNVCVEMNNYTPVDFELIKRRLYSFKKNK